MATVGFSYISICFASIYRSTDSRRFPHPGGIQLPHIKGCCFDLATFWCCGKLNALHFWDVLQETQSWDAEAQLGNLVYLWSMSLRIKSEDQLVAAVWPNHAASFLRSNYQADAKNSCRKSFLCETSNLLHLNQSRVYSLQRCLGHKPAKIRQDWTISYSWVYPCFCQSIPPCRTFDLITWSPRTFSYLFIFIWCSRSF